MLIANKTKKENFTKIKNYVAQLFQNCGLLLFIFQFTEESNDKKNKRTDDPQKSLMLKPDDGDDAIKLILFLRNFGLFIASARWHKPWFHGAVLGRYRRTDNSGHFSDDWPETQILPKKSNLKISERVQELYA